MKDVASRNTDASGVQKRRASTVVSTAVLLGGLALIGCKDQGTTASSKDAGTADAVKADGVADVSAAADATKASGDVEVVSEAGSAKCRLRGAPLPCNVPMSSYVYPGPASAVVFGDVPVRFDGVEGSKARISILGEDCQAIQSDAIEIGTQADYTLGATDKYSVKANSDTTDTVANLTVTKNCKGTACASTTAPITCESGVKKVETELGQNADMGGFVVRAEKVTISGPAKTGEVSVLNSDCSVAKTLTVTEGQTGDVGVGTGTYAVGIPAIGISLIASTAPVDGGDAVDAGLSIAVNGAITLSVQKVCDKPATEKPLDAGQD